VFVRDRGSIENILFSNITIRTRLHTGHWWGNAEPIHLSVIPARKGAPVGKLRNVTLSNITADSQSGIVLYGHERGDLSNISLDNVRLTIGKSPLDAFYGGNFDLRPVFDRQFAVFRHDIPALFCRNVNGCAVRAFNITWDDDLPEFHNHAIFCEQSDGLVIDGFQGRQPHVNDSRAAIALTDVRGLVIRNCIAAPGTGTFLSCDNVEAGGLFVNNDLHHAKELIWPAKTSFTSSGNRGPASP